MEKQKWEYKVVSHRSELEDDLIREVLNHEGFDGWELVSVSDSVWEDGVKSTAYHSDKLVLHRRIYYFKRPRADDY